MAGRRPFEAIRVFVRRHGGTMLYEKKGHQWGVWIVRLDGKERVFPSNGSGFPELDKLYIPNVEGSEPQHWMDYSLELLPDAWEKFMGYFS